MLLVIIKASILSYLLSLELNRSMRIQSHHEMCTPSSEKGWRAQSCQDCRSVVDGDGDG